MAAKHKPKRTFAQRYKAHPYRISARNPRATKRALRTPGLRKSVPWKYLPPKYRRQRINKQPIMPGSTITKGQFGRETKAAATTKYGPLSQQQRQAVGEAKAYQRDIGNYYTDYLNQVQQQSQNVNTIGQQAQTAVQNLQGGVTGLAQADLTQMNQAATADAAARGATPGDLAQMASGAAATRQALVGSFAAEQAARNAAGSRFASNRANVVAPGQRLGAVAQAAGQTRQARERLAETQRERGAFRQQYGAERKSEEAKTILAKQALGLDVYKAKADVAAGKAANRASVKKARIDAAAQVAKARADAKKNSPGSQAAVTSAESMARTGAKYGYTYQQWKGMTPAARRKIINAGSGSSGGGGSSSGGKGPKLLTPGQSGAGLTQLSELKSLTAKAKAGQLFRPGTGNPPPLGRYAGQSKVTQYAGSKLKHPSLARAAADAVYDGHISAYTEKQLRRAGYRPVDVAQALGVLTHGAYVRKYAHALQYGNKR